ncbi:MAG: thiolase family protein [Acetobacteraceae bacterium]|nr:thiolase family protein [Acetobacteraceae bacterium]
MRLKVQPGVIGVAIRPMISGGMRSLEEIMYDTAQAALADAGLTIEEIDGIVCASNDQFDGRAISVMMASGPLGGVDRDILSTPSSSEHAFILGALRIASGQYRTQLVVSWSPTEVSSMPEAQRLGADPYFHRALPLDELSAHAMQAAALEHAVPGTRAAAIAVAAKNRANGATAYPDTRANAGKLRWPLTSDMTNEPVTGAVALVLATENFIAERDGKNVAWLRGMGWATEPAFLGDRNLAMAPALESAARQAYDSAAVTAAQIDIAEITDATPYAELLAYEALGLSPRANWAKDIAAGRFAPDGALPVNLSGGVITHNPVFSTGLIRIAEIANQVRGRAGAHQRKDAQLGIAHAGSGPAMQYQSAIILGRERGARA